MNKINNFQTSDLILCTTICYFGYCVESIIKTNPKKVVFVIKRDKKLDNLVRKYWNHKLLVEPMIFFNCLKEIKTRIYSID
jgi:hypothetical protein